MKPFKFTSAILPTFVGILCISVIACGGSGSGAKSGTSTATATSTGTATASATGTATATSTATATATATGTSGTAGTFTASPPVTTAQVFGYSSIGSFVATNRSGTPTATVQGISLYPPVFGPSFTASDAQLQALPIPAGNNYASAKAVNSLGAIVGEYGNLVANPAPNSEPIYQSVPCYWASPTSAPIPLILPTGETNSITLAAISKSGVIYGHTRLSLGSGSSYGNNYVWPTPTSQPMTLHPYAALNYEPGFSISDSGVLVNQGTDMGTLLYTAPYTSPLVLMTPDGTPGGISTPFAIGPDGTVFGSEFPSSGARGFYIKGPAYGTGAFLPGNDVIHAMNSLGQAVGESDPGGGNFGNALFWSAVTATPTTVQSGSPGNQAISALVIFDNDIIKTGDDYGNFYWVKRN